MHVIIAFIKLGHFMKASVAASSASSSSEHQAGQRHCLYSVDEKRDAKLLRTYAKQGEKYVIRKPSAKQVTDDFTCISSPACRLLSVSSDAMFIQE